jgi:hypothetical protein
MSTFSKVTSLVDLHTKSLDWTIKVRVGRMWNIKSLINPDKIFEIQLILLDQEVILYSDFINFVYNLLGLCFIRFLSTDYE